LYYLSLRLSVHRTSLTVYALGRHHQVQTIHHQSVYDRYALSITSALVQLSCARYRSLGAIFVDTRPSAIEFGKK